MWWWFLLLWILPVLAVTASAQDTSTPEERAQWVEVTHKLESAPLDDGVNKQGEAAFKRLSDVHDVHVLLCPALLSEFNGMKYAYAHTITRQYMMASGSAAAGGSFFPAPPLCLSWLAFLSAFTTGNRGWGPWLSRAQDGMIRELVRGKGRFFP